MWSLSELRTALSDRLGETSQAFWDDDDRDWYINEAQRMVAAITRGVQTEVSGSVDSTTRTITLPAKFLNGSASMGYVNNGRALPIIDVETANRISPAWRTFVGNPLWIILDVMGEKAIVTPAPSSAVTVYLNVSVLPTDMVADGDAAFDGVVPMEKYQGTLVNFAAALALLKERYDGDAERFYQFAVQELQSMGTRPHDIPSFQDVRERVDNG